MKIFRHVLLVCRGLAIDVAMRRPAPRIIPLSDPDKMKNRDYFVLHLGDNENPWRFLVESKGKQGMYGRWYDDDVQDGVSASIPAISLLEFSMHITQYFGELELRYRSCFKFLVYQFLQLPQIFLAAKKLSRFLFRQRKLRREDRIKVLQMIVDDAVQSAGRDAWTSAPLIMHMLYGPNWYHHGDSERLGEYYRMLLDSLVASGDMERNLASYRLAPSAFATLAKYEEENRRHRDQVRQQKIIGFLTFALVAVGSLQAYVTYITSSR